MPIADNSHQTKIRHLANKNIAVYRLTNLTLGLQGAKNPEQSTYIKNVEGKVTFVEQNEFGQTVDNSVDIIYNQVYGLLGPTESGSGPSGPTGPPILTEWILNTDFSGTSIDSINYYAYGNGKWVMVGSDSSGNYVILTTTDPTGNWDRVMVNALPVETNLYGVFYGDKWLIVGENITLTATDPTVWTSMLIEGSLYNVYYGNSTWIVTTIGNGIYVPTALDDINTWTYVTLLEASYAGVQYANNVWAIIGTAPGAGIVLTAENPIGPWIPNDQSFPNELLRCIVFGDGIWALLSDTTLYTATDPAGTWTANTSITTVPNDIAYGNGCWIYVDGQHNVYTAADPRDAWAQDTSPSLTPSESMSNLTLIKYGGNTFVTTGIDNGLQLFTFTE